MNTIREKLSSWSGSLTVNRYLSGMAVAFCLLMTAHNALAYDISVTVQHPTGSYAANSHIYVTATGPSGVLGTSVLFNSGAETTVSIQGATNGPYVVEAFLDTVGNGIRHYHDPATPLAYQSMTYVNVASADAVASGPLTLSSPTSAIGWAPTKVIAYPGTGSAVVEWEPARSAEGYEFATHYKVEWATDAGFTTNLGASPMLSPRDAHLYFVDALTPSTSYYFRVTPYVDFGTLQAGTPTTANSGNPLNIVPTGSVTVSGTVTLGTGVPTGFTDTLVVALVSPDGNGSKIAVKISGPHASPVGYSVNGVPEGTYRLIAFNDSNNNGAIDTGEYMNRFDAAPRITVKSGAVTGSTDIALDARPVDANAIVQYSKAPSQSSGDYSLMFDVQASGKLPVGVILRNNAGTQLPLSPLDVGVSRYYPGFSLYVPLTAAPIEAAEAYLAEVTYSDGTNDTNVPFAVLAPLPGDNFLPAIVSAPPHLTMVAPGTSPYPAFSWNQSADGTEQTYSFHLYGFDPATSDYISWDLEEIPKAASGPTAIAFGDTALPSSEPPTTSLTPGFFYEWSLGANMANGNRATLIGRQFYYGVGGSISGIVKDQAGQPVSGALVEISDMAGRVPAMQTATLTDGSYSFSGIPATYYEITASATGYVQGATATPNLVSENGSATAPAIILTLQSPGAPGAITGTVSPPGTSIELLDGSNNPVASTNEAAGTYSFTNVAPGTYFVKFSMTGYTTQFFNGMPVFGQATPVYVTTGSTTNNINATLYPDTAPNSIQGKVWDGTNVLQGVTVKLYAADGTTLLDTTTTNASGDFAFNNLGSGDFWIFYAPGSGYQSAWHPYTINLPTLGLPPYIANATLDVLVTLGSAGVTHRVLGNGNVVDTLDAVVNGAAATLGGMTLTVTGPDGFFYSFADADIKPHVNNTLLVYKEYTSLAPGVYTFTLNDGNGNVGHRVDTHVTVTNNIPPVDSATIQQQRKSDGSYRFGWAPVNDTRTYSYRLRIERNDGSGVPVHLSTRTMASFIDVPAGVMTDGAAYRARIEVTDSSSYDLVTNRSDSAYVPFTPQAADFDPSRLIFSYANAYTHIYDDGTQVTAFGFGFGGGNTAAAAAVTSADVSGPIDSSTPFTYTFQSADLLQPNGVDFFKSFATPPATGTYRYHIVANGLDHYAYVTLTPAVVYPAPDPATYQSEELGDGKIRFSWADVDHSGALYYRVQVRDTVTGFYYSSPRLNQTFADIPKIDLGDLTNLKWRVEVFDSPSPTTQRNRRIGPLSADTLASLPAFDAGRPVMNDQGIRGLTTSAGGGAAEVWSVASDADGTIAELRVDGPNGYNRNLLTQGGGSNGAFVLADALSPAAGLYTFTVTDDAGKSAVRYNLQPAPHAIPAVDYRTLKVNTEPNGDLRFSWAPVVSDVPLWYYIDFWNSSGFNLSDLAAKSSAVIPSSWLQGQAMFRVKAIDGSNDAVSNNASQSVMVGYEGAGFDYASLADSDNDGFASNADADDYNPAINPFAGANTSYPFAEYPVDANTIALYHFNSANAGLTPDSTGNHDGSLLGNAQIATAGKFGGGLLLDGSGSYVRVGNIHQNPPKDYSKGTVEAWVNLSSTSPFMVILGSGNEYGNNWDDGWYLGRHPNSTGDNLAFMIWSGGGWRFADSGITPESLVGGWHHVAGTWGPKGIEVWVDGVQKGANTSWTSPPDNANYSTALIGTDSWSWNTVGTIDEVRISDIQRDFFSQPVTNGGLLVSRLLGSTGNGGFLCSDATTTTPSPCATTYPAGTAVSIQAVPATGSTFTGWSGACSGTNPCSVTVDGTTNVFATFRSANTLGGVPGEGNLSITMNIDGSIGIYRFVGGEWQEQVFGWDNKGSLLHVNGTAHAFGYFTGNGAAPTLDTAQTERIDDTRYRSVWTTASGATLTQTITYEPGSANYNLQWEIANTGATDLSDIRFFHGQDTFFFGDDFGAGFWDAANSTVGVEKNVLINSISSLKRMSLQGVTAPFGFDSQFYETVLGNVNAFALTNTLNINQGTDNGYALEWRLPTLPPNGVWTIVANEKIADVALSGGVSVTSPVSASCAPGAPCILNFSVTNTGTSQQTVSLDASSDQPAWTATLESASITVEAGASRQVSVTLTPDSAAGTGTIGHVTLSANSSASDTATVTINPPLGAISGRVTNGTAGLPDIAVVVSDTAGNPVGASTDFNGNYVVPNLPAGSYTVRFLSSGNVWKEQYYNNRPDFASADLVTVNPPATTNLADAILTSSIPAAGTLSGTISYSGTNIGRVYITVRTGSGTLGTSISAPGSYTIRGVPPGSYTVNAFMDTLNLGAQVQVSPAGTVTVDTSGTSAVAADITLTDPVAAAPPPPKNIGVSPGDASVLIGWDRPRVNDVETADSYDIYWGTSADVSTSANSGSRLNVPAGIDSPALVEGLTNGAVLYFVVIPKSGGIEGIPSAVVGPITVGATTGGNTVSGTVSYSGSTPSGPLYVAVVSPQSKGASGVYYTKIPAPTDSQAFSVSGVPDGTYEVYAIFDMNSDRLFGNGDVTNTDDQAPIVTLSGAGASGVSISLAGRNADVTVTTNHGMPAGGTGEWYTIEGVARGQLKRPVAVTLTGAPSGSQIMVPIDIGLDKWGEFRFWNGVNARPTVGDEYTFSIIYDDGSSESKTASVTGVSDNFPADAQISTPVSTVPTFTWGAPVSTPAGYSLWVGVDNNNLWDAWELPNGQLSVVYNIDGRAQPLQLDTQYNWNISARDQNGNRATIHSTFTPTVADTTPPTVDSTTPADGATNVAVNSAISAVFSEAIDPGTLTELTGFLKDGNGAPVAGTGSYDPATRTARFTPSAPLAYATTYTATLTTGVMDLAGNPLEADFSISFTTGPAPVASVTLGNLNRTYTGSSLGVTAATVPPGLPVTITYNDSIDLPVAAGSYNVVATVNHPNYTGTNSGQLLIGRAAATITLSDLSHEYDGTAKAATATTTPDGLNVNITYSSSDLPVAVGEYNVTAIIDDPNYQGSASGKLVVASSDIFRPEVKKTEPADREKNVAADTAISVTFNEPVNPATVAITMDNGIGGTQAYDSATNTVTFRPSQPLGADADITVSVSARDAVGNAMSDTWRFKTASLTKGIKCDDSGSLTEGVDLSTADGSAKVNLPAGTVLSDINGTLLTGALTMKATPTQSSADIPGLTSAVSDSGRPFSSLGAAIDIAITSGTTLVSSFTQGTMNVNLMLAPGFASVGSTVSYYSNSGSGWQWEGFANVNPDGSVDMPVTHLSVWAVARFLPTGKIASDTVSTVTIADALRALQIAVGLIPPTENDLANGDVAPLVGGIRSPNGSINVGDAIILLQKSLGLITNW